MSELKLRHELKHYINYADYLEMRSRLQAVMMKDPHTRPDGTYFIRSLYFDNLQDKALREKIDGINIRDKYRIRFYNNDTSRIMLEKKSKIHGLCKKSQTSITKEQCELLLAGDISFLRDSSDVLFQDLYTKMNYQLLRPKTIIDYKREPYIYETGNVRITFDSEIRTGLYCKDFLDPEVPTISAGDPNTIILEVKYDEFLPEIIQMMIQLKNRSATAFSKYAIGRMYG